MSSDHPARTTLGKFCKKHPELQGLRYSPNRLCIECAKEDSRTRYAGRDMTPFQEIKSLKEENHRLTKNIEMQKSLIISLRSEITSLLENPGDAL